MNLLEPQKLKRKTTTCGGTIYIFQPLTTTLIYCISTEYQYIVGQKLSNVQIFWRSHIKEVGPRHLSILTLNHSLVKRVSDGF